MNRKILITGFGPFGEVLENPSQKLINGLIELFPKDKFICEVLPVSYSFCEQWVAENSSDDLALIIHFGVAMKSEKIRLEKVAKNYVGFGKDIEGCGRNGVILEHLPEVLLTKIDLENLSELLIRDGFSCEISEDAGDYLCNFIYFYSLANFSGDVLFVHIPSEEVIAVEELVRFTKVLVKHLQFQVK